jgi:hypothetical protein
VVVPCVLGILRLSGPYWRAHHRKNHPVTGFLTYGILDVCNRCKRAERACRHENWNARKREGDEVPSTLRTRPTRRNQPNYESPIRRLLAGPYQSLTWGRVHA